MKHPFQKFAALFALVGLFMFSGVMIFQLQVAFGWTNPLNNPPLGSGALGAFNTGPINSQVFLNTVAPSGTASLTVGPPSAGVGISVLNNLISDVNTPIGGKDAANKNYVDAQVGGGGGAIITLFGVSWNNPLLTFNNQNLPNPAGTSWSVQNTLAQCLRGNLGSCKLLPGSGSTVAPGGGTPACPSGFSELYAGYGPHSFNMNSYINLPPVGTNSDGQAAGTGFEVMETGGPWETWRPFSTIMGTYSICSTSKFEIVQNNWTSLQGGGGGTGYLGNTVSLATACAPDDPLIAGAYEACNTCRVCMKD